MGREGREKEWTMKNQIGCVNMSNQKRNETNTLDQKCQTQYIAFKQKAHAHAHTRSFRTKYSIRFVADNSTHMYLLHTYVVIL